MRLCGLVHNGKSDEKHCSLKAISLFDLLVEDRIEFDLNVFGLLKSYLRILVWK